MTALLNTLKSPLFGRGRRARSTSPARCTPPGAAITLDRVLALLESTPVPGVISAAVDAAGGRVRLELEAPRRAADQDRIGADVGSMLLAEPGVTSVSVSFLSPDQAARWLDARN